MVTDATKLLSAVAEGNDDIYEITRRLCRSILNEPLIAKAIQVRRALAEGDTFVVVRAVELAEMVLGVELAGERRATVLPSPDRRGGVQAESE